MTLLTRFDYYTNYEETTRGSSKSLPAPLGTIPIHVRGGVVIPTQEPASNTVQSRKNPFGLIIALDDSGRASGSLYWDGGDTIQPLETGDFALFEFAVENVSSSISNNFQLFLCSMSVLKVKKTSFQHQKLNVFMIFSRGNLQHNAFHPVPSVENQNICKCD